MSSAASVVSKKKASSFVVAASMSAVEALKDQAGLCRWDYAIRSVYHRAKLSSSGRRVFSPVSASSSSSSPQTASAAACAGSCRSRRAEEEKLHKAYHLVCWGPN